MANTISNEELQRLRSIAATYKTMVLLVGLQLLLGWFGNSLATATASSDGRLAVLFVAWLATACALAVKGHRLAELVGHRMPWLWGFGMFVPLVNLVCLLSLSRTSQAICKKHGIRVGLLGPDMDDVARLESAARDAPPSQ